MSDQTKELEQRVAGFIEDITAGYDNREIQWKYVYSKISDAAEHAGNNTPYGRALLMKREYLIDENGHRASFKRNEDIYIPDYEEVYRTESIRHGSGSLFDDGHPHGNSSHEMWGGHPHAGMFD